MDAKLDKLNERVHAAEKRISNIAEREADKEIYAMRKVVVCFCFFFCVGQNREIRKQDSLYLC